jgi:hypothetical protein
MGGEDRPNPVARRELTREDQTANAGHLLHMEHRRARGLWGGLRIHQWCKRTPAAGPLALQYARRIVLTFRGSLRVGAQGAWLEQAYV